MSRSAAVTDAQSITPSPGIQCFPSTSDELDRAHAPLKADGDARIELKRLRPQVRV